MPSLTWNDSLANNLPPMDETHREFVDCYNAVASAAPEDFLPAFDRLIAHTVAHFDLENGWMAAVDFPGCHRGEHDRVLAVMHDIRKRVEKGDMFLGRRLIEELPAWFENHVNGMDAALAFHLDSIGFDFEQGALKPLADGEQRGAGCACASMNTPETVSTPAAATAACALRRRSGGEEGKIHRRPTAAHEFGQRRGRAAGQRPPQRAVAGVEPQVGAAAAPDQRDVARRRGAQTRPLFRAFYVDCPAEAALRPRQDAGDAFRADMGVEAVDRKS